MSLGSRAPSVFARLRVSARTRRGLYCAGLVALALLQLRYSSADPQALNFLDRALLRIASPLSALVTGAAQALGGGARRYVYLVGVEKRNAELEEEVARLRAELARAERGALAADGLERLLELQKAVGARTFAARVVATDTSAYFRSARVHLGGHPDAIRPGMAVLVPAGVVGRIQRTYGAWGDVALVVDPAVAVDVFVGKSQVRGIVRGKPGRNRLSCLLQYVERAAAIEPGDRVLASGADGIFPRGAIVGTVERVTSRGGLFVEAEVKPAVDFAELREVLIAPGLEI